MTTGADRIRVFLLGFGLSCIVADAAWLLGRLYIEDSAGTNGLLAWAPALVAWTDAESVVMPHLQFFGAILVAQWFFLRPRRDWKVQLGERGRPMRSAIGVAAVMATLLSAGALGLALDVAGPNIWNLVEQAGRRIFGERGDGGWAWYTGLFTLWCMWAILFRLCWRERERSTQLGRMITGLVSGSLLELFVSIGVHAWDPRNEACWCARGSFLGIVFSATVLIWAFGPGLLLLFWRRQRERERVLAARSRE